MEMLDYWKKVLKNTELAFKSLRKDGATRRPKLQEEVIEIKRQLFDSYRVGEITQEDYKNLLREFDKYDFNHIQDKKGKR